MSNTTLSDERAIANALGNFARILDRKEWQRSGEVFATDVTFNYGDGREQSGLAAMEANFMHYGSIHGPSQHLLGSIQIEIDGDRAVTNAYVQARHQGRGDKAHLYIDTNGEYMDRWERRPEGWRIVRRDVRWDLMMGDMSVLMA